jgi:hypothetical protein
MSNTALELAARVWPGSFRFWQTSSSHNGSTWFRIVATYRHGLVALMRLGKTIFPSALANKLPKPAKCPADRSFKFCRPSLLQRSTTLGQPWPILYGEVQSQGGIYTHKRTTRPLRIPSHGLDGDTCVQDVNTPRSPDPTVTS